jgi:TRAP-type C4-dicarboxylate transport system permease large subunit
MVNGKKNKKNIVVDLLRSCHLSVSFAHAVALITIMVVVVVINTARFSHPMERNDSLRTLSTRNSTIKNKKTTHLIPVNVARLFVAVQSNTDYQSALSEDESTSTRFPFAFHFQKSHRH